MTLADYNSELLELWRISRTAGMDRRVDRLNWAAKQFNAVHPEFKKLPIYKHIHSITEGYGL